MHNDKLRNELLSDMGYDVNDYLHGPPGWLLAAADALIRKGWRKSLWTRWRIS